VTAEPATLPRSVPQARPLHPSLGSPAKPVANAALAEALTRLTTVITPSPDRIEPAPRKAATPTWVNIINGNAGTTIAR